MAEKIIDNPSLLPGDLAFELSGNTITAISGHPIAGSGGGTQSDYVYYPDFDETTGNIEFKLGTIDNPPSPIGDWHISGADGARGPQGEPGDNGKTPTFQINSENAHWEWKYTDAATWTDTHVVASGAVGPKGDNGDNGISPTISTTPITDDPEHPQGGTKVTVIDSTGTEEFKIWNGANGEGATVNLKDGDGIHITQSSNDYTIGVSANYSAMAVTWVQTQNYLKSIPDTYALKTDVEAASANALSEAKSWVNQRGYLTQSDLIDYATETYVDTASAAALSQAKSWVNLQNFATTTDIADMATETWVGQQGYLTSIPDTYATKTYVETASANAYNEAVARIPTDYITKDVDNLTYYYKKTETYSTTEITNALSTKLDSTVAAQTYQTKADMTNYLTTSDASTTYATKTYANEASANALNQAKSWVETEGYIKSVPDITANNGLSATGHTVGISTTNIDANKQYAWTTTGWQLVSVPTIPDITAHNGLSADGHTVGIDDTNIAANKQYAWTTNGWNEIVGYLPTSGGTVSGQLVVSGGGNFDQQFLKITRENVNGYGRIGLGSSGPLAFKVDDANSHTTQINISPNTTNDQLVQVQHNSNTVGYLIPAIIEQAGWTPSTDDKILHIVLASE